ncbi:hypothetical protein M8J77_007120 [Diaphorina citri]|nr:hypothetical protein M8J77_007120 [Diaphorina citri]
MLSRQCTSIDGVDYVWTVDTALRCSDEGAGWRHGNQCMIMIMNEKTSQTKKKEKEKEKKKKKEKKEKKKKKKKKAGE